MYERPNSLRKQFGTDEAEYVIPHVVHEEREIVVSRNQGYKAAKISVNPKLVYVQVFGDDRQGFALTRDQCLDLMRAIVETLASYDDD